MKQYHIGYEDAGKRPFGYQQKPGLLIIHAVKNIDYLPPYLWKYIGIRETTKKGLKERLQADFPKILKQINTENNTNFTAITIQ